MLEAKKTTREKPSQSKRSKGKEIRKCQRIKSLIGPFRGLSDSIAQNLAKKRQKDNWSSDNWSFDNWTRDNWASRQLVFWTTGLIDNWTFRQLDF